MANKKLSPVTGKPKRKYTRRNLQQAPSFPPIPPAPKDDTIDFALFLQAVAEAYPDKLAAGVSLAWLPDKMSWYASICRYSSGVKSIVMAEHSDISMSDAVFKLAQRWKNSMRTPPKAHLEDFLGM